jgi:zinc protease
VNPRRLTPSLALSASLAWSALTLASCASAPPVPTPPPAPSVAIVTPVPPPVVMAPARVTPDATFRAAPPAGSAEPTFAVPPFERFKLKNGLEVVLAETHDLPLVDLNLVVKSGAAANAPELAGLADLTRRMLEEGTAANKTGAKARTAPEISDELATLGAALGGGSGWDSSNVSLSVLTKNLDPALELFCDLVLAPAFAEKDFTRVRDNQLQAIARRKDSPPTVANLAFSRLVYGQKHPYGWPGTGAEASLKKMKVSDVRAAYDARWRPNNAVLIVAGDVTEAALRPKLEAAFRAWKSRAVAVRKLPPPAPASTTTKIFLVDKADAPQSSIRVGGVGIARANADYFPVLVMNMIFGGGFYRLDLNLREGKAWTYGARSSFETRKTPGPYSAGGEFVAAHTAESVGEILKELNGMRDADVSDAELARAKAQIIKSFPARFATRAQVSGQLADLAVYGLPADYLATYTTKIGAVTKDDVRRVARKYLEPGKLTIVVVGDETSLKEPLAKLGPVELRDVEGNPVTAAPPAAAAPGGPDKE